MSFEQFDRPLGWAVRFDIATRTMTWCEWFYPSAADVGQAAAAFQRLLRHRQGQFQAGTEIINGYIVGPDGECICVYHCQPSWTQPTGA